MKGFLPVEIRSMLCTLGDGEDDFDDHSEAKMGGEPRPTGRANLFDTRNNKNNVGYCIIISLRSRGK